MSYFFIRWCGSANLDKSSILHYFSKVIFNLSVSHLSLFRCLSIVPVRTKRQSRGSPRKPSVYSNFQLPRILSLPYKFSRLTHNYLPLDLGLCRLFPGVPLVLASIESDNYNTAAGAAVEGRRRLGAAAGVRISISCSPTNFGCSRCQQFPLTTNTISR